MNLLLWSDNRACESGYFMPMRCLTGMVRRFLPLMLLVSAPHGVMAGAEFIGSTPGGAAPREFLGGLETNAACHCIMWQVTLLTDPNTGRPTTYDLTARYRIPTRRNPNQSEDGPKVRSEEHTSELQSRLHLVCRLLLEK